MPDPKPTFDKIKVRIYLDTVWDKTIDPCNFYLKITSRHNALLESLTQIGGYLQACMMFDIIDQPLYNELWTEFKNKCAYEGKR